MVDLKIVNPSGPVLHDYIKYYLMGVPPKELTDKISFSFHQTETTCDLVGLILFTSNPIPLVLQAI